MFQLIFFLVAALLLIGALVFFTGKPIAGMQPTFGKGKPVPSKEVRMAAGSVFLLLAGAMLWVGLNTSAVLRYLTS